MWQNRLGEIRQNKGLSQLALASMIGVSQATIQRYECGNRDLRVSTVLVLCKALDVSIVELLGLREDTTCLSSQEKELITNYRECSTQEKEVLASVIKLMSK